MKIHSISSNKILITSVTSITLFMSACSYASINHKRSGFIMSASGGIVENSANISWENITSDEQYHYNTPTYTGGTGNLRLGYQLAFGNDNNDSTFYLGGAFNAGLASNMISTINVTTFSTDSNPPAIVRSTNSSYGGEFFIGQYWASPFYTELYGLTGVTSEAAFFLEGGIRAGYDLNDHLGIFAQFGIGGQFNVINTAISPIFGSVNASTVSYTNQQIGVRYRF